MKTKVMFILTVAILSGCKDVLEMVPIKDLQPESTLTRSINESCDYYWCDGVKYTLTKDDTKSYVVMESAKLDSLDAYATLGIEPTSAKALSKSLVAFTMDSSLQVDLRREDIMYQAPYFRTSNGSEIGITNVLSLQLKDLQNFTSLCKIADECNLEILGQNRFDKSVYFLSCTKESRGNALEMANLIYESGICRYASPEFIIKSKPDSHPNDSYFSNQWNLFNINNSDFDIDYVGVADFLTPRIQDIIIAVVDNGIYSDHEDLPLHNVSYDAHTDSSPSRIYGAHGTAVAGVIGATSNNNIGIAGVASGVKIMPVSICYTADAARLGLAAASNSEDFADAIRFAADHGAHVINNSWSFDTSDPMPNINSAIEYAQSKGCVVVFSSGNDTSAVAQPAAGASCETLVVGSTDRYGNRSVFSNYGPSLDLVAPGSSIWTTTWMGEYGLYSGTSLAAPHVAAIAGLMFSVNPTLSNRQICDILEQTAHKLPGCHFYVNDDRSNGVWSDFVGYGLVNCYDAVNLAENYTYYDRDSHVNLIKFDYSGTEITMRLTTKDDIAIFWDYGMANVSHIQADENSPVDTTITHTYGTSVTHHVMIGELELMPGMVPRPSMALTEFELTTGAYASNFEISHANSLLRYIKIVGGEQFEPQALTIENMIALEDLYLIGLKYADVTIRNCSELETICTSPYVWRRTAWGPELIEINSGETLNPNVVGGSPVWPTVPEKVIAPQNLNISGCSSVSTLSLENVNCISFNFNGFPSLRYVYLSSLHSLIVGAGTSTLYPNPGYYLSSSIATLPDCPENSMPGTIVIRAINNSCTSYIPVSINSQYKTAIENNCSNKGWGVIWDSGVTVL